MLLLLILLSLSFYLATGRGNVTFNLFFISLFIPLLSTIPEATRIPMKYSGKNLSRRDLFPLAADRESVNTGKRGGQGRDGESASERN